MLWRHAGRGPTQKKPLAIKNELLIKSATQKGDKMKY
jgi:hypothetical protein